MALAIGCAGPVPYAIVRIESMRGRSYELFYPVDEDRVADRLVANNPQDNDNKDGQALPIGAFCRVVTPIRVRNEGCSLKAYIINAAWKNYRTQSADSHLNKMTEEQVA